MGTRESLTAAASAVTALTGRAVTSARPLGGACLVRLVGGGAVVAKRHDHVSGVAAEVAGLRWVAAAVGPPESSVTAATDSSGGSAGGYPQAGSGPTEGAAGAGWDPQVDASGPPESSLDAGTDSSWQALVGCPQVLGQNDEWLVIEAVEVGAATAAAAEGLGRGLAQLHLAGAPAFGAAPPGGPVDAWIGLAPMRNETGTAWPEWYAEHRVLPYLRAAVDQGVLHEPGPVETVCARLGQLAGPAEPPARLHGDLWSGNVLWGADGMAWLIDPAAHGGHRETDLAMLRLFGCAQLERVVAAYDEVAPLTDGWRERVALHQLFPLLVHAVLFGGGYGEQAVAAARQALTSGL